MLAAVAFWAVVQGVAPSAREALRALEYAIDRGQLDSTESFWRSPQAGRRSLRMRRLASAIIAANRYRYAEAERDLQALRRERTSDAVGRRAAFELARVHFARGYPRAALPWLERATGEAWAAHDTMLVVDVLLSRAGAATQPAAVTALLDSVESLGRDREPHVPVARLCRQGGLLHSMGEHRRARELLHRGSRQANGQGFARTEARCRLALMVSFINTGETDSMRVQYETLSRLATSAGDLITLGSAIQWAGTYLVRLGRPALARANLDSAFKLGRLTQNDVINAWSAFAFSDLALSFGDAKGAYAWLQFSDSLMRARGDALGIASIPSLYSRLAWLRGDYEAVLRLADSSLARSARLGNVAAQVAALDEQRHISLRLGRNQAAATALEQRRDLTIRHGLRGYESLLERSQGELELWNGSYRRADSLLAASSARLHATQFGQRHDILIYRSLAKLLDGDIQTAERLARDAGGEYVSWRASLTNPDDRKRAAQSTSAFGDPYGLPRLIAELVKRNRAGTALELSEQRRAKHLMEKLANSHEQSAAASVTQLLRSIPDSETAVLQYVLGVGDAPTSLIVATRDTVAGYSIGPASTLAQQVARLTSRLEARQDAQQVSRELGERLLAPAQALLARGIKKLLIVPDGALNFLPFDALIISRRYVLDAFEVSVAPSLTVAARWWQSEARSRTTTSLVFGDPAYQRSPLRMPFGISVGALGGATTSFPRLPASGREARRVAALLGDTELYVGNSASEERLRRAAGRLLRVLHIAGHAVADDWSSDRSFIALASGEGHDGVLSIADLVALDLHADLVVLSGCRTARGEIIGAEGVQSLAQPFLEMGSRAVLATTWAVDDKHAARLMERFYEALLRGGTLGQSLHEAKLALRRAGVAASEWSAYNLLGDAMLKFPPALKTR